MTSFRLRAERSPRLVGRFVGPGDKSISHRALILGAMAEGETRIEGLLEGRDVLDTAAAVRALGARVEREEDGTWRVEGARWQSPAGPIDCGNSGTGVRLLMGAVSGYPIEVTFTGDASLSGRPMGRVLDPLIAMGAKTDGRDKLPVTLSGGGLRGASHVNARASAQVKSAILLAGLNAAGPVEVIEPAASRDHTENMLRAFGCEVEVSAHGEQGRVIRLGKRRALKGTDILVPVDPSSAAFPIVAALIGRDCEVTAHGVLVNPLRAGLYDTLLAMGADLDIANRRIVGGEEVADITARSSQLRGINVPAERAPSMIDEYPILAVAAAFAEGETVMNGLAELRVKESDRLQAMLDGLRACGVAARAEGDTLRVQGYGGAAPGGGMIASHGDHRIAMSFLVLGLAAERGVSVDQAEMIATSFPDFVPLMRSLGAHIIPAS